MLSRWLLRRSFNEASEVQGSARQDHGTDTKGRLITSLQPLRIQGSPSQPPRAPTLQECEVIIRQLYNANSLQSQEVSALRWTLFVRILLASRILSYDLKRFLLLHDSAHLCFLLDCTCEGAAERYCFEQENHPWKLHSDQGLPRGWNSVKRHHHITYCML